MKKHVKILVVVIVLAVTALLVISAFNHLTQSGISEQFNLVDCFSRESEFVASYIDHPGICSDIAAMTEYHALSELLNDNSTGKRVTVPNQNRFIQIDSKVVSLYSESNEKLASFNINDLSLIAPSRESIGPSTGEFVFEDCIGITENTIFIQIKYSFEERLSSTINSQFLELSTNPFADSMKIHECGKYYGISMNESCSKAYLLTPKEENILEIELKVYDIDSGKISQLYSFQNVGSWFPLTIHYNSKLDASLILGFKGQTCHLACFNHKDKNLKFLAKTENAYWFDDEYIYFTKGNQLWRTTKDGLKEMVYCPKRKTAESYFDKIHVGTDKTFLVYDYCISLPGTQVGFGRLMLDIQNMEYRLIDKGVAKKVKS